jgi:F-box protein 9
MHRAWLRPVDVVHSIRPSFRAKGLLFGTWALIRPSQPGHPPSITIRELLEPGVTPKYEFEMDLSLKTTNRGRWNKLDLDTYRSINLATDESLNLSLKHQKPFYFSK